MRFLYTTGIRLYGLVARLAALGNSKAAEWVKGQRQWKQDLLERQPQLSQGSWLWIHVASMGEYEQAAPIIEACRLHYPQYRILLSFFSPSGYNHWVKRNVADAVVYLPLDTPANARFFLDICRIDKAIFIKYEYWFNFIRALEQRKIPLYFVSSRFRDSQYFFKPWAGWFVDALRSVAGFFVQDQHSVQLLSSIGVDRVCQVGDTRFDRVMKIVGTEADYPLVKDFPQGRILLMSGSSWPQDESVMMEFMFQHRHELAWVIVPHELQPERLSVLRKDLESKGFSVSFYSDGDQYGNGIRSGYEGTPLKGEKVPSLADVLVVDKMGMLSKLYRYADIAYIGGGFGKGIHNVLEAAAYGIPVVFGPNCHKFGEAIGLLECQGGFMVEDASDFASCMEKLMDEDFRSRSARKAGSFVRNGLGAVEKVMKAVFENSK